MGIDADTIIAADAISRLVPHFINPKVGAIAGNAKVGNRVNLWTRWQALEYITSQNFERRALDVLGAVSVVPGAIGAWRVSSGARSGGYHVDTVAEDADLTMALLRLGYRVEYEDMALAYTEAPTNANGLMRQRFRWSFGILQAVYNTESHGARRRPGLGRSAEHLDLSRFSCPLVSPLHRHHVCGGRSGMLVRKHYHPDSTDPASFHQIGLFFFAVPDHRLLRVGMAFALERRQSETISEDGWLLSQVWLRRIRRIANCFLIVLIRTLKRAIEGRHFAWDKLERTAAVNYVPAETAGSGERAVKI